jgi:hypothetical protein
VQRQTPLWFSARRRQRSRVGTALLKAALKFFALLLFVCASALLLLISLSKSHV